MRERLARFWLSLRKWLSERGKTNQSGWYRKFVMMFVATTRSQLQSMFDFVGDILYWVPVAVAAVLAAISVVFAILQKEFPITAYIWPTALVLAFSLLFCRLVLLRRSGLAVLFWGTINPLTIIWVAGWAVWISRS
jgi:hypothetical protein